MLCKLLKAPVVTAKSFQSHDLQTGQFGQHLEKGISVPRHIFSQVKGIAWASLPFEDQESRTLIADCLKHPSVLTQLIACIPQQ